MLSVSLIPMTTHVVVTLFSGETKEKVDHFSNACYKRFDTLEQAEAFIINYGEAIKLRDILQSESLEDLMQRLCVN
jgi:viroplasmin and RNaseH domain-containing protein